MWTSERMGSGVKQDGQTQCWGVDDIRILISENVSSLQNVHKRIYKEKIEHTQDWICGAQLCAAAVVQIVKTWVPSEWDRTRSQLLPSQQTVTLPKPKKIHDGTEDGTEDGT